MREDIKAWVDAARLAGKRIVIYHAHKPINPKKDDAWVDIDTGETWVHDGNKWDRHKPKNRQIVSCYFEEMTEWN